MDYGVILQFDIKSVHTMKIGQRRELLSFSPSSEQLPEYS